MNIRVAQIGWSLFGLLVPLVIAAVTVPALLRTLGSEKFGLLALAWGLIGYAGVLDLGVGRALTQMLSKLEGLGKFEQIPDAVATASRITLITGLFGGFLIACSALLGASNWIVTLDVPPEQIRNSMLLLAIALPAQAMSATFKGVNEAQLNFKGISFVRMALGGVNFAGPYVVAFYSDNLIYLVLTLVVSRLIALIAFYILARSSLNHSVIAVNRGQYKKDIANELFGFGLWITLSSALSPILVQADRFVIGAVLSASLVTVYVLPYEVVLQSLVLVGAITSVIFPVVTRLIHEAPNEWGEHFNRWLLSVTLGMGFCSVVLWLALPELLNLWVKDQLQSESVTIGRVLCFGVFLNAVGSMFYALQHALGKVALTAKFHIFELIVYIPLLYLLINLYGVVGAAYAWVIRVLIDTVLLMQASWIDIKRSREVLA